MAPPPAATADADLVWREATDKYQIALDGATLVCRNDKGKRLKSVPKAVRDGAVAEELLAVRDFLERHERHCHATVESWMLGALPIPVPLLLEIWPDPAWRQALADLAVAEEPGGEPGLLRQIDDDGRIGVVNLDAETEWIDAERLYIPHPVLLPDLDDVRDFAVELGVSQRVPQLVREVFTKPDTVEGNSLGRYGGGVFDELRQAKGRAIKFGFGVRGGYATTHATDGGTELQARYWLGDDGPDYEAYTGDLLWVDDDERPVPLTDVGPIAWSEGVRMAELIYAGRKTDDE
ncbi:uncharacterized protein DUF4132 [Stackebrandtia albiflava]|uniref:Uncharacterized protein DUF4132 n=1 Tax=Stackebrandtia albiflava TaxID=406432 RepID=A0A562UYZ5_9ACTN|nr:DUF4132 domain-containing protein [Stackebrandtia albiflava]TWJ10817.1 uncharacterized protein DUF4132 [Stackebrandtia albiflava]